MKKFLFAFIILNFSLFCVSAKPDKKPELKSMVSIEIDGQKTSVQDKASFSLYSEKFNIVFDGITEDQTVCLFAGTDSVYETKYKLPVKADDTEIFCNGCGLAEKRFSEIDEYYLSVTSPYTFHYLYKDRRINTKNGAFIPVSGISDPTGKFKGNLYLSIFVDFNNNRIIESNEYVFISLHFPLFDSVSSLDFSQKNRGYFSTIGFSLRKTAKYTGKEFKVYKICSESDFDKVCQIENRNLTGTTLKSVFMYYFENNDYSDKTHYIAFIPYGYNQVENCFRLKGSSTVYIEYQKSLPEDERCINIRCFNVPSNSPDPEVEFYSDGKLTKGNIISFN